MARAAFLMDRIMGVAGMHGRASVPLLSSFAWASPGLMAARVIDDRRDRRTTILIAPLMTCAARFPVCALRIGAFVPAKALGFGIGMPGLAKFGLHAAGAVSALAVAFAGQMIFRSHETAAPLVLGLPDFKLGQIRGVVPGRAGAVIFTASLVIRGRSTFPFAPAVAGEPAINCSVAAMIGHVPSPVGFSWEICVGLVPGMAARFLACHGARPRRLNPDAAAAAPGRDRRA
ncbi:nucleoside recognition domain-containing protein [Mangrovicoccus ximenensis]|uniref:nucleoside recognition domain-containing protein n=1 Tax=Mangrovicoccus ximenensis TaxID=1911570 RepID=UPI000D3C6271|nr:nucleoside recognition domain-containing protein [Mangrovicoccus ximenensis]